MPKKLLPERFPESPPNDDLVEKVRTRSIGPNDPNGIRARRRKLCFDAEGGDRDAMKELLDVALRLCTEIDINTETSTDRIAFASLVNPIKYLLSSESIMLAAFGAVREANRPKSKRTEQLYLRIAKDIGRNLAAGCAQTQAVSKAAEANGVSERTAQRVFKKHHSIVSVAKIMEEKRTKSTD